jgi:hypothetical protein
MIANTAGWNLLQCDLKPPPTRSLCKCATARLLTAPRLPPNVSPDQQTIPAYMSDPNHFWVFYAYNTNQGYLQAAAPQYWKPSTINRDQILTRPGDLQTGPIISSRDGIRITPDRIGDSVVRPLPREVYEPPLLANQLGCWFASQKSMVT